MVRVIGIGSVGSISWWWALDGQWWSVALLKVVWEMTLNWYANVG